MGTKRTLQEIDAEIEATKRALENVHGDETEVYARIVGYYRSVRNWNKGKKDEYKKRMMFRVEDNKTKEAAPVLSLETSKHDEPKTEPKAAKASGAPIQDEQHKRHGAYQLRYELYIRTGCPHCPSVRQYMANSQTIGKEIVVDDDAGLADAALHGVFSTPTVIFYDEEDQEVARAHNVDEIKAILIPAAQAIA